MRLILIACAVCTLLVTLGSSQAQSKIPRVGILFIGGRDQPHLEAFKQGLHERGYLEGKNILLEYRYAEGKEDRLRELAAELVQLKVDVILVTADVSAQAAQEVTKTTPIVMTTGDPVSWGLAKSLARPGGNVTGLTVLLADLSGKRIEILRETLPKMTRVAALWSPTEKVATGVFQETKAAAQGFSLQLQSYEVRTIQDIEKAFTEMTKERPNALVVLLTPLVTLHSKQIVELALQQHLPVYTPQDNLLRKVASWRMDRSSVICIVAPPATLRKFSKGQNPPIFLSSNQPNSSWSLI